MRSNFDTHNGECASSREASGRGGLRSTVRRSTLRGVAAIVVSKSGGTSLRVEDGRWLLTGPSGSIAVQRGSVYGLLPLLERDPSEVTVELAESGGPAFPLDLVIEEGLRSDSAYWQEASVAWLWALGLKPAGSLREAATYAVDQRVASQPARHDLLRWLRGKPAS